LPPFHALRTRPRTVAALLVALALAVGGCSGSSDSSSPSAAPSSASNSPAGSPTVKTQVVVAKVAGNLHQPNRRIFKKYRKHLQQKVGKAVDAWFDGGFVGVHYPRDDFPTAFATFTAAAKKEARHQQQLMTNWKWRHKIDGVTVKKRKVSLDVLAPNGRPAGVTARVHLTFKTTGDAEKKVSVSGRLFLARDPHGTWRIFGYDVAKGAR
jgi:hypothetical protein